MSYFENVASEFYTTVQTGSVIGKPWHLSFIKPSEWTEPDNMEFHKETVNVTIDKTDYQVYIEYAVLTIERPWFHINLFSIPFSHHYFAKGEISDEMGKGFLPVINTGIIVTRKIEIKGYYKNNNYQIVGWIIKNIPLCPRIEDK